MQALQTIYDRECKYIANIVHQVKSDLVGFMGYISFIVAEYTVDYFKFTEHIKS